jgi:hypothetical protein
MAEQVQLNKTVYGKITYLNVIDTQFSQLLQPQTVVVDNTITIDQFFQAYNDLFYEIPVEGDVNSHLELIIRSTEYTGVNQNAGEIDALLDEINQLRLENLTLQQTIDELTASK